MKNKRLYFIFCGVIFHFFIIFLLVLTAKHFQLTPKQFFYRFLQKSTLDAPWLTEWLVDTGFTEKNMSYHTLPEINKQAPRLLRQTKLLTSGALQVENIEPGELAQYQPCRYSSLLWLASCYFIDTNERVADALRYKMANFKVIAPNINGHHSNGWKLALAYDSQQSRLSLPKQEKIAIQEKLRETINHYLLILNEDSASLWHTRATLAAQMWVAYLALADDDIILKKKVAPHFYSLVEALEQTEAWPEGYSYWINSRAFSITLALSGYLNGTQKDNWHSRIKKLLTRIGYWHIYATRPDNTIEPLGDEGPRLDLRDETRRVIDIIAQSTQDPWINKYSLYLADLHGRESYFRGYRWGWLMFNSLEFQDNFLNKEERKVAVKSFFSSFPFPSMDIFGAEYFGQAYIHQRNTEERTFISYRAGDSFTHHGHADNGHLSLFKESPLLVNSSLYENYTQENRVDYSIRSIAKNTIQIQRPGEYIKVTNQWGERISDGGQRVTMPLGSAILSLSDWFDKRHAPPYLKGGKIIASQESARFNYLSSDLTHAYNSQWYDQMGEQGKVVSVKRKILYLSKQDVLIVKDDIETTEPSYRVKLLYHTFEKPLVQNLKVIVGEENNGISVAINDEIRVANGRGRLKSQVLGDHENIMVIGGDDYQFYVETDNDDTELNGRNMIGGARAQSIEAAAKWRFEINLPNNRTKHSIATIHFASIDEYQSTTAQLFTSISGQKVYIVDDTAVTFDGQDVIEWSNLPSKVSTLITCNGQISETKCKEYFKRDVLNEVL